MADGPKPNPFGYADHSPFAAFGVELVYGMLRDGTPAHISTVRRGLACDCVCPACGRVLIARKGEKKVEHFGHYGAGSGCGKNAETNAHSWAKEVLDRERRILLPAVVGREGRERLQTHSGGIFEFASAALEKTLGDIVPDVILTTHSGQQLLVEVKVTHPCGPEKIAKLRERGLATLEVDLSAWRKSSDRAGIEAALIAAASRAWLFNRKQENATEKLREEIALRAAQATAAAHWRQAQAEAETRRREDVARHARDARIAHVVREVASAQGSESEAGLDELAELNPGPDDGGLFLADRTTCGFRVSSDRWQAALYVRLIRVTIGDGFYLPQFDLDDALSNIVDCIADGLAQAPPDDILADLPDALRGRTFPREAVEDYLHHLCAMGILQGDGAGGFELHDDRVEWLEKRQRIWKRAKKRREAVDKSLDTIFDAIPILEQDDFSLERWARQPVAGFELSLGALCLEERPVWSPFETVLAAIGRMVGGGPPVLDTLGLPLAGEIKRACARESAAVIAAADAREQRLRQSARAVLRDDAQAWLTDPGSNVAPVDLARKDEGGLALALDGLERERVRIAARKAADLLAADCRARLQGEADKALGKEIGSMFLKNYDAQIGASPWMIATDQAGLRLARLALEQWEARNRRKRR